MIKIERNNNKRKRVLATPFQVIKRPNVNQEVSSVSPWWNDRIKQLGQYFPAPVLDNLEATSMVDYERNRLSQWHHVKVYKPKQTTEEIARAQQRNQLCFASSGASTNDNLFANDLQQKRTKTVHVSKRSKTIVDTNKVQRTWKIRIRPTPIQKQSLHRRFGIVNLVYNETLRILGQGIVDASGRTIKSSNEEKALRKGQLERVSEETFAELNTDNVDIADEEVDSKTGKLKKIDRLPHFTKIMKQIMNPELNPRASITPIIFNRFKCPYDSCAEAVHEALVSLGSARELLNTIRAARFNKEHKVEEVDYKKLQCTLKRRTRHDPKQHIHIKGSGGSKAVDGQEKVKPKIVKWNEEGFQFWTTSRLNIPRPQQSEQKQQQIDHNEHKIKPTDYDLFGIVKPYRMRDFIKMKMKLGNDGCDQRCTLKYERPGRYYLCIPYYKTKNTFTVPDEYKHQKSIVALDPGGKTFQAAFDDQGSFQEYGKGASKRLYNIYQQVSKISKQVKELQQQVDHNNNNNNKKEKKRTRYHQRRKLTRNSNRLLLKVKDLRRDMHTKLSTHLLDRYTDILLPQLQVGKIVKNPNSNLPQAAKDHLLAVGHNQFRMRIMQQAEIKGSRVHTVNEYFTSQTCGFCGFLYKDIGASRTHHCTRCATTFDRDMNAARMIFLSNVEKCCGSVDIL